ncbi:hypothetical protein BYT27DRAFT_7265673 [Phlegmacium glaucopus]|nr:hypothetical protein BYT27DRAFT_7265673 [Phlegmacium glaucopus]
MRYCYHVESSEEVDLVAQSWATTILIWLNRDVKGFPLVPPPQEGDTLVYVKQIIRSFITTHYCFASGHEHDRVPWKWITENTADFINSKYLPENTVQPYLGEHQDTDQSAPTLYKQSPSASIPMRLDGPINDEPINDEPINGEPIEGGLASEWDAKYISLDLDGDVNMDPGLNHRDSTPVPFSPQPPWPPTSVIDPQLILEESVIMKEGDG